MIPFLTNFNLATWIETNKQNWGNSRIRVIWESSDYVVFVSRGPTTALQFHIGSREEIFYQIEGDLHFHYIPSEGERKVLVLHPGEMFLLPAQIPHSSRRPSDSCWTVVVERPRGPNDPDRWVWYCENCNHKLHETAHRIGHMLSDPVNDTLIAGIDALRADEKLRTCSSCGNILPILS